jgi:hypothetical protein
MAKIKQKITVVKTRVKKDGTTNAANYAICKNCGGDGVVRVRKKHK